MENAVSKLPKDCAYQYRMSANCRLRKRQGEAFIEWIKSNPTFEKRRPTLEEVIHACKTVPALKGLMKQTREEAAQEYWKLKAQELLRHVEMVVINIKTEEVITKPIVAYIPIKFERNGHVFPENYIPAKRVANDASYQVPVIERMYRDLMAWWERYQRYIEFFGLTTDIEPLIESVQDAIQNLKDAPDPDL